MNEKPPNITRYLRQVALPEIGSLGQERLSDSKVLCVGVGGLGCPALLSLAGAGVGMLGLIDSDTVSLSNLQRQTLFDTSNIGELKVTVAEKRLKELNPELTIKSYPYRLELSNALEIFKDFDIIIDGTDNFTSKYLINDAASYLDKPVVYGSVSGLEGRVSVFWSIKGPCYRCLYPAAPDSYVPNCSESGVLGALTGIVGNIQAMEVIKLALDSQELKPLIGKMLIIQSDNMNMRSFNVEKSSECERCAAPQSELKLEQPAMECTAEAAEKVDSKRLLELIESNECEVIDVRTTHEWRTGHIAGAKNIPLRKLIKSSIVTFSDSNEYILYCQGEARSKIASQFLKKHGVSNVKVLSGGLDKWNTKLERS